jgi:hypothetical protein
MEIFVGACYDIDVVTVSTDREGKPRPPEHWYSVVHEIHPTKSGFSGTRTHEPFNPEPFNPSTPRTQKTHSTDQHSNTVNTPLGNSSKAKLGQIDLKASV